MQSSNPIAPARRGSFALALAVTVASLIMGGEVALAECQPPTGSPQLSHLDAALAIGATFNISNQFAANATLYGQNAPDSDFWISVKDTGKNRWFFEDTNGCYWEFPQSTGNTNCFVQLSAINQNTRNIYVFQGLVKSAVVQVVYWPQRTATPTPPPNPPAENPTITTASLPHVGSGTYAAYAEIELSVVPGGASVVDVSVLNRYNFAHQLLYWESANCAAPTNPNPDYASGFNGNRTSAGIYDDLTAALSVPKSNGYFPAHYPDQGSNHPLMRLNGVTGTFDNAEYSNGQWFHCGTQTLLPWGLETNYLNSGFSYNGTLPEYGAYAPVSQFGNIAQNVPIDTNSNTYSPGNDTCGVWHPSKSSVSRSGTNVPVAQTFGNKYGGASGYLSALYAAMPPGGYFISNSQAISVDPGIYNPTQTGPLPGPRMGGSGYSFNLNICETKYGPERGLTDYHLELRDIRVFNTANSGPGKPSDPTFQETHPHGEAVWYPAASCGSPLDFQMQNPPRGRFGVPTDPLTCLLVEGAGPNHLPASTLSDQYDYPYVYTTMMVADGSGNYGQMGGPILANAPNDPYTLLKDTTDTSSWPTPSPVCQNPHGTGRTFTPPGYQALRLYLLEQTDPDNPSGIREYVATQVLSNVSCVVAGPAQPPPPAPPVPLPTVSQGTLVWQVRMSKGSCGYFAACPASGFCTNCPIPIKCPLSQGQYAGTSAFCNSYVGPQTWSGAGSKGTGLKPDNDTFNASGFPGWDGQCATSNLGGQPFNWAGPFADASSSIYPVFFLCTNPNGCKCFNDGPGGLEAIADGWVELPYPKPLKDSIYWTWPPAPTGSPLAAPSATPGVPLEGTFNWFGPPYATAQSAVIKIGSNGYPEPYFYDQPLLQWQSTVPNPNNASYTSSHINWESLWTGHPGESLLWSACDMPSGGPYCEYGQSRCAPAWGGGKIVPHIGNWTDMFVNTGGAPQGSLVMFSNNYPQPSCPPQDPTEPTGGWGPCPSLGNGSQGLFGFDPFIGVTGWPAGNDPEAALKACGVVDPSLEGWFSQELIAAMLADVSTVIQFGLLTNEWNDGPGLEYYMNALGVTGLPFSDATLFKKPIPSTSYSGPYGNSYIKSLLENSLGYNGQRGGFPTTTTVIPAYVSTYADRFKLVSPAFPIVPNNSYFQWRLGVPTTSSVSDIDGDGCVGSEDLTMLLAAWGACGKGNCPEDLNQDGIVEGGDLVHVLAEWGVGCGSP